MVQTAKHLTYSSRSRALFIPCPKSSLSHLCKQKTENRQEVDLGSGLPSLWTSPQMVFLGAIWVCSAFLEGNCGGKEEAAGTSGLGSCGGEADKAELAFPSSNTGNGLTGKPAQLLGEQGSWVLTLGSLPVAAVLHGWQLQGQAQQNSVQKSLHRIDPALGTGGLDDLSRSLPTNPCFTGLCGSCSWTHACDSVTVLKLNGKVTWINNLINLFIFTECPLRSNCNWLLQVFSPSPDTESSRTNK